MRISTEIEKLRLYAGSKKKIGVAELATLVPDSSVSTLFELVDALGRRDRLRAFGLVDTLLRQGEYMPLALNFLASLFRSRWPPRRRACGAPADSTGSLKARRPVWRAKAEQIHQTASGFSQTQLETGLKQIFSADWGLRDARPSDRLVMEKLILGLAK